MVRVWVDKFCDQRVLALVKEFNKRGLVSSSYPNDILEQDVVGQVRTLPSALYAGFDPTADSLHIGNLIVLANLLRGSLFGCNAIALIGGATALIGDPSGKNTERKQLSVDHVKENSKSLVKQLVEISENAKQLYDKRANLTILNNSDWFEKFRMGDMLRMGHIKTRLEGPGLSFTEFSYQVLQSYDWLMLSKKYNCLFQLGGSDQLGHLDSGAHLIKAMTGKKAAGVCLPLLTDKDGNKIGKSTTATSSGVWLSETRTAPFHLYQYFRQLHDDVAEQYFNYFSLRPWEDVQSILKHGREVKGRWIVQKALAEEVVMLVHGPEDLQKALKCSNVLYDDLDYSTIERVFGTSKRMLSKSSIKTVGDLAGATKENTAYNMNLVRQGAFKLNGIKYMQPDEPVEVDKILLKNRYTLVNWGKRNYVVVDWKD